MSGGHLSPYFNPATGVYTMAVPNRVSSTTVRTTLSDSGASVAYNTTDADSNTTGHQVNLTVGETEVVVTVTAVNDATRTYTTTVTRDPPTIVSVEAPSAELTEGDDVVFTLTRNRVADGDLTVTVNVTETGDMVAAADEVTGQEVMFEGEATTATCTVPTVGADSEGNDEIEYEAHSTVTLGLSSDFPRVTLATKISPSHDWFAGLSDSTPRRSPTSGFAAMASAIRTSRVRPARPTR